MMKMGDKAFFYHSGKEKAVVGIVKFVKEYYPDPADHTETFGMVDFKVVKSIEEPVTLADIKAQVQLKHLTLVNNTRLSVQPVEAASWKIICKMAGSVPEQRITTPK